jgi:tRNA G18 (ribose-2'-O)-methylase SpoU
MLFKKKPIVVICDNIRSLENVGSIFRTSDAFLVEKVYLCGISGKPPHHKISKTALGSERWIDWEYQSQAWRLVDKLKKDLNFFIVSLENNTKGEIINNFSPKFPLALVIGNEIKGVSKSVLKRSDKIVSIPMYGKKESLNVAVAFGIALYHINNFRLS